MLHKTTQYQFSVLKHDSHRVEDPNCLYTPTKVTNLLKPLVTLNKNVLANCGLKCLKPVCRPNCSFSLIIQKQVYYITQMHAIIDDPQF